MTYPKNPDMSRRRGISPIEFYSKDGRLEPKKIKFFDRVLGEGILTWRIIRVFKRLVTPFKGHLGHLEGKQPYLGDLLAMVINNLLIGMILQVAFAPRMGYLQRCGTLAISRCLPWKSKDNKKIGFH